MAPSENMSLHATFSSTLEKKSPERKPSTMPMLVAISLQVTSCPLWAACEISLMYYREYEESIVLS